MNRKALFIRPDTLWRSRPQAFARIKGSALYPNLTGTVRFYEHPYGVVVVTEVEGLPNPESRCSSPIFALHIHQGSSCTREVGDPFADSGMHYNPQNCLHPYHAGDLPPLFGANGYAFSACLTNRFSLDEIIGRTVILHSSLDDFSTQPSGNSGTKIACGEIVRRLRWR
ncbi:MAG: superoxide dismutase family protein [Clostridia bacterium]|nr:superoxide dismutase family protein [Clostridia bacterium]